MEPGWKLTAPRNEFQRTFMKNDEWGPPESQRGLGFSSPDCPFPGGTRIGSNRGNSALEAIQGQANNTTEDRHEG
jgi:hypothetical protein